jgi:predicted transcriptional regulator
VLENPIRPSKLYDENSMTAEERRIANAALNAGSFDNHDQLASAVAAELEVETQKVETVLERLRNRQVLNCAGTSRNVQVNPEHQKHAIRYEKGIDWTDED